MPDLKRIVLRSGPCLDSVPLLGLYLKALRSSVFRWPAILSRLKFSPDILANIRASALPPEEKSRLFSEAMTPPIRPRRPAGAGLPTGRS